MTTPAPERVIRFPSRLAFDPGHTTGIAASYGNNIVYTGTIFHNYLAVDFLEQLLVMFRPSQVIVEEIPPNNPDKITRSMYMLITKYYEHRSIEVITVMPGIWKPVRKKLDPFWSEHIKDATGLLFYEP